MPTKFHIDPGVFKAYDIRGIVPDQIDLAAAGQVARAFVAEVQPKQVVVGRDVRLTGPQFMQAVIEGLSKSGVDVLNIGQVSTDEFYFACATKDLPGIMVTASHNPSEYNGFKMVKKMPNFVMAKEFRHRVIDAEYDDNEITGLVKEESVTKGFIDYLLSVAPADKMKPLKVVIDTSNGSQGPIWEELSRHLPIEIVKLCFEPDGSFPNHGNDIIQPENQEMLRQKVKETSADLGLIFDPDGDRCLAVDDRGISVPGDWLTALLAVEQLRHDPGATILYDVRASDAVPDMIKAAGGEPFVWKPGHVYIKQEMQKRGIVFGGEVSGHFYFKDFWFADSGILAGLMMLLYVSGLNTPLSVKVKELEAKYFLSGEINSKVADPAGVLANVKSTYHDAEINELSGIAIRYPDWHAVVRPSDNEPLVRLTVEASTRQLMEQKRDELLKLIRS
ncbi:MAG: Phosphoglucomutase, Phosphomannomutase [Candidatus Saccharibacteria bacterium]|nr:Phosphoglucomutase, Phosphomannomutase [Candidatus Saccharibacteria bacterium]